MTDYLIIAVIAYFLGSIPFGVIVSKLAGTGDLRKVGSGNIGATNMMRAGGKKLATIVLLLDMAKAYFAVSLAWQSYGESLVPIAALFAVIGHIFPVWLRFKGGKGVASALGAFFAMSPLLGVGFIAVWAVVFFFSRVSAIAAIAAMAVSPFAVWALLGLQAAAFIAVMSAIVIYRHKENICRIINGEELGFKPKD